MLGQHQSHGTTSVAHGGDLGEARAFFPDAPLPWIDLSTGINPVPYPLPPLDASAWTRLPGPGQALALEGVAAQAWGAGVEDVVVAPGTQALLERLPQLRSPGRVAVVGPTYAEHARCWRRAGHEVAEVACLSTTACTADVVVLCNPNNPDGRVFSGADLHAVAHALASRGGWLVVDEAFADLEPMVESMAAQRPRNAVVLRSFGKAYGLAGVRLGFGIAEPPIASALRDAMGPWAVSGPALAVGKAALKDVSWLADASRDRALDAARLDALLSRHGRVVGGTRLFRLLESGGAQALFARLGHAGVWVRRFADRPEWLRFGLPGSAEAWGRLEATLASADGAP